jgi:hypothetical protein
VEKVKIFFFGSGVEIEMYPGYGDFFSVPIISEIKPVYLISHVCTCLACIRQCLLDQEMYGLLFID